MVINYLKSGRIEEGVIPYHIVQTIDGDECTLGFSDYDTSVTANNYLVAVYVEGNSQQIYILEEYTGGIT